MGSEGRHRGRLGLIFQSPGLFHMTTENEESTSTSLVVIERITALDVFKDGTKIEALIAQIKAITDAADLDASSAVGRAEIRSLAMKVKRSKTYLDGVGKELVDDLKALPKLIDASRKIARDQLDALHDEVRKPLTDWEDEQARIKEEKEAAERAELARIEAVQAAITGYVQAPLALIGKPSAEIIAALTAMINEVLAVEFFGDRLMEAETQRTAAIEKLTLMAAAAKTAEDQAQAERDRAVAEQAAARERAAAEQKILDARLATERAEQERKAADQRAADAERRQKEAEAKAAADSERAAAEATAREQARAAAEKAAADKAEAARAANVEHRKKINNEAVTALTTHAGLSIEQARATVKAIAMQQVLHVTINY
jgi:colicin import membrane protein